MKGMKKAVSFFMALSLISALSLSAVAAENDGPGGPSAPVISQSGTLDTWLDAEGNEVSEGTGTKYTTNLLTDKNIGSWTGVQAFKSVSYTHLDMPQNDNVLIRRFVKQQRRFRHQGVEPSTGLIHGFGDKLCRELLLKQILIFKWIMVLCKRHCAGVKPAVDHLSLIHI